MNVTGYLALYTTLLGWQQYQNLWSIAAGTGLLYLPFIGIILKATFEPFTSMGGKNAAQIGLRRLIISLLMALFVIAFAAVPSVPLNPGVLHYLPTCSPESQAVTPGHTGTSFDKTFPVPTGVKVPIFWYLVMAFANGVTNAAITGLPCAPMDLRSLHDQLDTSQIADAGLKQDVSQFYKDCYVPAYSAYLSGNLNTQTETEIKASLAKNGSDDVSWLGSQTLQNIAGLYDNFHAQQPIQGFRFNPSRDIEEGQVANHSEWGKPNCRSWWTDPQNGIHAQLLKAAPITLLNAIEVVGGNRQQLEDATAKTILTHSFSQGDFADHVRGYQSLNDNESQSYVSRFVGGPVGTAYESLSFYPKLHLLINALPVIQGILLFALYTFIALALPFASFRIGFCITGAVVIFSVIFCSYLWQLTQWFDNYLIQALYPGVGGVAGMSAVFSDPLGTNEIFVDMIIGGMYVVLPMLWMSVMGWAGIQVGNVVSNAISSMATPAEKAGQKSGNIATTAISKLL